MVEKKIGRKRPKTKDLLQRRYGWPLATKKSASTDLEVLVWMRDVTEEIWNQRYGKEQAEEKKSHSIEDQKRQYAEKENEYAEEEAEDKMMRWLTREAELEEANGVEVEEDVDNESESDEEGS